MTRPRERWIATQDEPLSRVLERLGQGAALGEGRVFVAGRRAFGADEAVRPGDAVEVYAAREPGAALAILYESDGLVFVEKPAGIATEPERRGSAGTVVALAATALGLDAGRVHALSRLDVGVSGVVLLGTNADARRRITALREAGRVRRRYVAVAAGVPEPERGSWDEPIRKGAKPPLRELGTGGEAALTHYLVAGRSRGKAPLAVLALEPETGRTHQLRVHAAAHAAPLVGDPSYGGPNRLTSPDGRVVRLERVLLHAAWLEIGDLSRVSSALPALFAEVFCADGGDAAALSRAVDAAVRA
jgi:23S rRNA-/tRNA-specific pseudouridylate synthase